MLPGEALIRHFAHLGRDDGRRSSAEVLGFTSGVRHGGEELGRAFFPARFERVLDDLGYATFMRRRLYTEERLRPTTRAEAGPDRVSC